MKQGKIEPKKDSPWLKTQYSNLIRYKSSGVYFARFRVHGKLIWKSLKTDQVTVAKLRLGDLEKAERQSAESQAGCANGKMTFSSTLDIYKARLNGDVSLKPRSKSYYHERINALERSWPSLGKLDVRRITRTECLDWAGRFSQEASPTAYNNTVSVLRHVLDVAVELGARYDNPARFVKRARPQLKKLHLPSQMQFEKWVAAIENAGVCQCHGSADLVRFLAYSGLRKGEASNVTWGDVDLDRGTIRVRGDAESGTKNSEERIVPIIEEMRGLLERLRSEQPHEDHDCVMRVGECQGNMDRATELVKMKRITHHDLRHLFATRCIESGVDIPTVSRWLGHKDGGALAMKVYGHLRDQHSAEMAKRVSFSTATPANVVQLQQEAIS